MRHLRNQTFSFLIASDVGTRDGLGVEAYRGDHREDASHILCEVFRDDTNRTVTFSAFEEDIPFEVVEHACRMARETLATWQWPEPAR